MPPPQPTRHADEVRKVVKPPTSPKAEEVPGGPYPAWTEFADKDYKEKKLPFALLETALIRKDPKDDRDTLYCEDAAKVLEHNGRQLDAALRILAAEPKPKDLRASFEKFFVTVAADERIYAEDKYPLANAWKFAPRHPALGTDWKQFFAKLEERGGSSPAAYSIYRNEIEGWLLRLYIDLATSHNPCATRANHSLDSAATLYAAHKRLEKIGDQTGAPKDPSWDVNHAPALAVYDIRRRFHGVIPDDISKLLDKAMIPACKPVLASAYRQPSWISSGLQDTFNDRESRYKNSLSGCQSKTEKEPFDRLDRAELVQLRGWLAANLGKGEKDKKTGDNGDKAIQLLYYTLNRKDLDATEGRVALQKAKEAPLVSSDAVGRGAQLLSRLAEAERHASPLVQTTLDTWHKESSPIERLLAMQLPTAYHEVLQETAKQDGNDKVRHVFLPDDAIYRLESLYEASTDPNKTVVFGARLAKLIGASGGKPADAVPELGRLKEISKERGALDALQKKLTGIRDELKAMERREPLQDARFKAVELALQVVADFRTSPLAIPVEEPKDGPRVVRGVKDMTDLVTAAFQRSKDSKEPIEKFNPDFNVRALSPGELTQLHYLLYQIGGTHIRREDQPYFDRLTNRGDLDKIADDLRKSLLPEKRDYVAEGRLQSLADEMRRRLPGWYQYKHLRMAPAYVAYPTTADGEALKTALAKNVEKTLAWVKLLDDPNVTWEQLEAYGAKPVIEYMSGVPLFKYRGKDSYNTVLSETSRDRVRRLLWEGFRLAENQAREAHGALKLPGAFETYSSLDAAEAADFANEGSGDPPWRMLAMTKHLIAEEAKARGEKPPEFDIGDPALWTDGNKWQKSLSAVQGHLWSTFGHGRLPADEARARTMMHLAHFTTLEPLVDSVLAKSNCRAPRRWHFEKHRNRELALRDATVLSILAEIAKNNPTDKRVCDWIGKGYVPPEAVHELAKLLEKRNGSSKKRQISSEDATRMLTQLLPPGYDVANLQKDIDDLQKHEKIKTDEKLQAQLAHFDLLKRLRDGHSGHQSPRGLVFDRGLPFLHPPALFGSLQRGIFCHKDGDKIGAAMLALGSTNEADVLGAREKLPPRLQDLITPPTDEDRKTALTFSEWRTKQLAKLTLEYADNGTLCARATEHLIEACEKLSRPGKIEDLKREFGTHYYAFDQIRYLKEGEAYLAEYRSKVARELALDFKAATKAEDWLPWKKIRTEHVFLVDWADELAAEPPPEQHAFRTVAEALLKNFEAMKSAEMSAGLMAEIKTALMAASVKDNGGVGGLSDFQRNMLRYWLLRTLNRPELSDTSVQKTLARQLFIALKEGSHDEGARGKGVRASFVDCSRFMRPEEVLGAEMKEFKLAESRGVAEPVYRMLGLCGTTLRPVSPQSTYAWAMKHPEAFVLFEAFQPRYMDPITKERRVIGPMKKEQCEPLAQLVAAAEKDDKEKFNAAVTKLLASAGRRIHPEMMIYEANEILHGLASVLSPGGARAGKLSDHDWAVLQYLAANHDALKPTDKLTAENRKKALELLSKLVQLMNGNDPGEKPVVPWLPFVKNGETSRPVSIGSSGDIAPQLNNMLGYLDSATRLGAKVDHLPPLAFNHVPATSKATIQRFLCYLVNEYRADGRKVAGTVPALCDAKDVKESKPPEEIKALALRLRNSEHAPKLLEGILALAGQKLPENDAKDYSFEAPRVIAKVEDSKNPIENTKALAAAMRTLDDWFTDCLDWIDKNGDEGGVPKEDTCSFGLRRAMLQGEAGPLNLKDEKLKKKAIALLYEEVLHQMRQARATYAKLIPDPRERNFEAVTRPMLAWLESMAAAEEPHASAYVRLIDSVMREAATAKDRSVPMPDFSSKISLLELDQSLRRTANVTLRDVLLSQQPHAEIAPAVAARVKKLKEDAKARLAKERELYTVTSAADTIRDELSRRKIGDKVSETVVFTKELHDDLQKKLTALEKTRSDLAKQIYDIKVPPQVMKAFLAVDEINLWATTLYGNYPVTDSMKPDSDHYRFSNTALYALFMTNRNNPTLTAEGSAIDTLLPADHSGKLNPAPKMDFANGEDFLKKIPIFDQRLELLRRLHDRTAVDLYAGRTTAPIGLTTVREDAYALKAHGPSYNAVLHKLIELHPHYRALLSEAAKVQKDEKVVDPQSIAALFRDYMAEPPTRSIVHILRAIVEAVRTGTMRIDRKALEDIYLTALQELIASKVLKPDVDKWAPDVMVNEKQQQALLVYTVAKRLLEDKGPGGPRTDPSAKHYAQHLINDQSALSELWLYSRMPKPAFEELMAAFKRNGVIPDGDARFAVIQYDFWHPEAQTGGGFFGKHIDNWLSYARSVFDWAHGRMNAKQAGDEGFDDLAMPTAAEMMALKKQEAGKNLDALLKATDSAHGDIEAMRRMTRAGLIPKYPQEWESLTSGPLKGLKFKPSVRLNLALVDAVKESYGELPEEILGVRRYDPAARTELAAINQRLREHAAKKLAAKPPISFDEVCSYFGDYMQTSCLPGFLKPHCAKTTTTVVNPLYTSGPALAKDAVAVTAIRLLTDCIENDHRIANGTLKPRALGADADEDTSGSALDLKLIEALKNTLDVIRRHREMYPLAPAEAEKLTVQLRAVEKEIARIKAELATEKDTGKRKDLASQLHKKLAEWAKAQEALDPVAYFESLLAEVRYAQALERNPRDMGRSALGLDGKPLARPLLAAILGEEVPKAEDPKSKAEAAARRIKHLAEQSALLRRQIDDYDALPAEAKKVSAGNLGPPYFAVQYRTHLARKAALVDLERELATLKDTVTWGACSAEDKVPDSDLRGLGIQIKKNIKVNVKIGETNRVDMPDFLVDIPVYGLDLIRDWRDIRPQELKVKLAPDKLFDGSSIQGQRDVLVPLQKIVYECSYVPGRKRHEHFAIFPATTSFGDINEHKKGNNRHIFRVDGRGLRPSNECLWKKLAELDAATPGFKMRAIAYMVRYSEKWLEKKELPEPFSPRLYPGADYAANERVSAKVFGGGNDNFVVWANPLDDVIMDQWATEWKALGEVTLRNWTTRDFNEAKQSNAFADGRIPAAAIPVLGWEFGPEIGPMGFKRSNWERANKINPTLKGSSTIHVSNTRFEFTGLPAGETERLNKLQVVLAESDKADMMDKLDEIADWYQANPKRLALHRRLAAFMPPDGDLRRFLDRAAYPKDVRRHLNEMWVDYKRGGEKDAELGKVFRFLDLNPKQACVELWTQTHLKRGTALTKEEVENTLRLTWRQYKDNWPKGTLPDFAKEAPKNETEDWFARQLTADSPLKRKALAPAPSFDRSFDKKKPEEIRAAREGLVETREDMMRRYSAVHAMLESATDQKGQKPKDPCQPGLSGVQVKIPEGDVKEEIDQLAQSRGINDPITAVCQYRAILQTALQSIDSHLGGNLGQKDRARATTLVKDAETGCEHTYQKEADARAARAANPEEKERRKRDIELVANFVEDCFDINNDKADGIQRFVDARNDVSWVDTIRDFIPGMNLSEHLPIEDLTDPRVAGKFFSEPEAADEGVNGDIRHRLESLSEIEMDMIRFLVSESTEKLGGACHLIDPTKQFVGKDGKILTPNRAHFTRQDFLKLIGGVTEAKVVDFVWKNKTLRSQYLNYMTGTNTGRKFSEASLDTLVDAKKTEFRGSVIDKYDAKTRHERLSAFVLKMSTNLGLKEQRWLAGNTTEKLPIDNINEDEVSKAYDRISEAIANDFVKPRLAGVQELLTKDPELALSHMEALYLKAENVNQFRDRLSARMKQIDSEDPGIRAVIESMFKDPAVGHILFRYQNDLIREAREFVRTKAAAARNKAVTDHVADADLAAAKSTLEELSTAVDDTGELDEAGEKVRAKIEAAVNKAGSKFRDPVGRLGVLFHRVPEVAKMTSPEKDACHKLGAPQSCGSLIACLPPTKKKGSEEPDKEGGKKAKPKVEDPKVVAEKAALLAELMAPYKELKDKRTDYYPDAFTKVLPVDKEDTTSASRLRDNIVAAHKKGAKPVKLVDFFKAEYDPDSETKGNKGFNKATGKGPGTLHRFPPAWLAEFERMLRSEKKATEGGVKNPPKDIVCLYDADCWDDISAEDVNKMLEKLAKTLDKPNRNSRSLPHLWYKDIWAFKGEANEHTSRRRSVMERLAKFLAEKYNNLEDEHTAHLERARTFSPQTAEALEKKLGALDNETLRLLNRLRVIFIDRAKELHLENGPQLYEELVHNPQPENIRRLLMLFDPQYLNYYADHDLPKRYEERLHARLQNPPPVSLFEDADLWQLFEGVGRNNYRRKILEEKRQELLHLRDPQRAADLLTKLEALLKDFTTLSGDDLRAAYASYKSDSRGGSPFLKFLADEEARLRRAAALAWLDSTEGRKIVEDAQVQGRVSDGSFASLVDKHVSREGWPAAKATPTDPVAKLAQRLSIIFDFEHEQQPEAKVALLTQIDRSRNFRDNFCSATAPKPKADAALRFTNELKKATNDLQAKEEATLAAAYDEFKKCGQAVKLKSEAEVYPPLIASNRAKRYLSQTYKNYRQLEGIFQHLDDVVEFYKDKEEFTALPVEKRTPRTIGQWRIMKLRQDYEKGQKHEFEKARDRFRAEHSQTKNEMVRDLNLFREAGQQYEKKLRDLRVATMRAAESENTEFRKCVDATKKRVEGAERLGNAILKTALAKTEDGPSLLETTYPTEKSKKDALSATRDRFSAHVAKYVQANPSKGADLMRNYEEIVKGFLKAEPKDADVAVTDEFLLSLDEVRRLGVEAQAAMERSRSLASALAKGKASDTDPRHTGHVAALKQICSAGIGDSLKGDFDGKLAFEKKKADELEGKRQALAKRVKSRWNIDWKGNFILENADFSGSRLTAENCKLALGRTPRPDVQFAGLFLVSSLFGGRVALAWPGAVACDDPKKVDNALLKRMVKADLDEISEYNNALISAELLGRGREEFFLGVTSAAPADVWQEMLDLAYVSYVEQGAPSKKDPSKLKGEEKKALERRLAAGEHPYEWMELHGVGETAFFVESDKDFVSREEFGDSLRLMGKFDPNGVVPERSPLSEKREFTRNMQELALRAKDDHAFWATRWEGYENQWGIFRAMDEAYMQKDATALFSDQNSAKQAFHGTKQVFDGVLDQLAGLGRISTGRWGAPNGPETGDFLERQYKKGILLTAEDSAMEVDAIHERIASETLMLLLSAPLLAAPGANHFAKGVMFHNGIGALTSLLHYGTKWTGDSSWTPGFLSSQDGWVAPTHIADFNQNTYFGVQSGTWKTGIMFAGNGAWGKVAKWGFARATFGAYQMGRAGQAFWGMGLSAAFVHVMSELPNMYQHGHLGAGDFLELGVASFREFLHMGAYSWAGGGFRGAIAMMLIDTGSDILELSLSKKGFQERRKWIEEKGKGGYLEGTLGFDGIGATNSILVDRFKGRIPFLIHLLSNARESGKQAAFLRECKSIMKNKKYTAEEKYEKMKELAREHLKDPANPLWQLFGIFNGVDPMSYINAAKGVVDWANGTHKNVEVTEQMVEAMVASGMSEYFSDFMLSSVRKSLKDPNTGPLLLKLLAHQAGREVVTVEDAELAFERFQTSSAYRGTELPDTSTIEKMRWRKGRERFAEVIEGVIKRLPVPGEAPGNHELAGADPTTHPLGGRTPMERLRALEAVLPPHLRGPELVERILRGELTLQELEKVENYLPELFYRAGQIGYFVKTNATPEQQVNELLKKIEALGGSTKLRIGFDSIRTYVLSVLRYIDGLREVQEALRRRLTPDNDPGGKKAKAIDQELAKLDKLRESVHEKWLEVVTKRLAEGVSSPAHERDKKLDALAYLSQKLPQSMLNSPVGDMLLDGITMKADGTPRFDGPAGALVASKWTPMRGEGAKSEWRLIVYPSGSFEVEVRLPKSATASSDRETVPSDSPTDTGNSRQREIDAAVRVLAKRHGLVNLERGERTRAKDGEVRIKYRYGAAEYRQDLEHPEYQKNGPPNPMDFINALNAYAHDGRLPTAPRLDPPNPTLPVPPPLPGREAPTRKTVDTKTPKPDAAFDLETVSRDPALRTNREMTARTATDPIDGDVILLRLTRRFNFPDRKIDVRFDFNADGDCEIRLELEAKSDATTAVEDFDRMATTLTTQGNLPGLAMRTTDSSAGGTTKRVHVGKARFPSTAEAKDFIERMTGALSGVTAPPPG